VFYYFLFIFRPFPCLFILLVHPTREISPVW
jgi:hypothetical protein